LLDAEAVQQQQVVSHGTATRGGAEDEVEVVGGGMWHRFRAWGDCRFRIVWPKIGLITTGTLTG